MSDLIHGGDLISASQKYGIPAGDWLDLSTGINPSPYPVPHIDTAMFQHLPYQTPAFTAAIVNYYGGAGLACSGSQQAIELLPALLAADGANLPVLLPDCGYQAHKYSWLRSGAELRFYPTDDHAQAQEQITRQVTRAEPCHLVLINPNNPTGLQFSPEQIFSWAEQMSKGSYLIVDEAFIDLCPEHSVLSDYARFQRLQNLVVLRSFGKFFGLAGVRLGFIFAAQGVLERLKTAQNPWVVNGPAQAIAICALNNTAWQQQARQQITINARKTLALWQPLFAKVDAELLSSGRLFISARLNSRIAKRIYQFFAERGVLLRLIQGEELAGEEQKAGTEPAQSCSLLRSGLVDAKREDQCKKLAQVIRELLLTLE